MKQLNIDQLRIVLFLFPNELNTI